MPLDFPSSPTLNQIYVAGTSSWMWDGTKWIAAGSTTTQAAYLPLTGGTMTGPITLAADPTAALQASTKQYVDNRAPLGGPYMPLTGGAMTGPLSWTSTGATRSWAAQDRTAQVIDIQDYGQIGVSAAVDTATMLAAVAALPANGGVLLLRSNNTAGITLNQTITITKSCKLLGQTTNGWCSSIVCLMSGPAILFSDPTPSYQKTFEVENVRFVANGPTATEAAIKVQIGPVSSGAYPSFQGKNITVSNNVASVGAPYGQTFTYGIEFVPSSVVANQHNFWNCTVRDFYMLGSYDTATSAPIAGTAGIAYGQVIYACFENVNVLSTAYGIYQTDYCEGITCITVQFSGVSHGWGMSAFAPVGPSNVKLLQPELIGSQIMGFIDAVNLNCVYSGFFESNMLQGNSVNPVVLLSDPKYTDISHNMINGGGGAGNTGISITHGTYTEGNNFVFANRITNCTTDVSFGAGTSYDQAFDNRRNSPLEPIIIDSGTNNTVRSYTAGRMLGTENVTNLNASGTLAVTGASTLGPLSTTQAAVNGPAASNRWVLFETAGSLRWGMQANSTAEGGGNVGSDLEIDRYNDTGGSLGTVLTIARSTGASTFTGMLTTNGGITVANNTNLSFGTQIASSVTDVSKHIALYATAYGFGIMGDRLNAVLPVTASFYVVSGGTDAFWAGSAGATVAVPFIATDSIRPSQTKGIVGTTTNNNANAGSVGEYVSSTGSGVAITSNTATNVTSISLTAGDWDVYGGAGFTPAGGATMTQMVAAVASTSGVLPGTNTGQQVFSNATHPAGQGDLLGGAIWRASLTTTTNVYLLALGVFATGTCTAYGTIQARRRR